MVCFADNKRTIVPKSPWLAVPVDVVNLSVYRRIDLSPKVTTINIGFGADDLRRTALFRRSILPLIRRSGVSNACQAAASWRLVSGPRQSAAVRLATKAGGNGQDDCPWSRYDDRLAATPRGLESKDTQEELAHLR